MPFKNNGAQNRDLKMTLLCHFEFLEINFWRNKLHPGVLSYNKKIENPFFKLSPLVPINSNITKVNLMGKLFINLKNTLNSLSKKLLDMELYSYLIMVKNVS